MSKLEKRIEQLEEAITALTLELAGPSRGGLSVKTVQEILKLIKPTPTNKPTPDAGGK